MSQLGSRTTINNKTKKEKKLKQYNVQGTKDFMYYFKILAELYSQVRELVSSSLQR